MEIWQNGKQWGVQLSDGKAYPAAGHPTQLPQVEKVVKTYDGQPTITSLKVTLAEPVQQVPGIGVSYSSSEQGRGVKNLLSTSEICFFYPEDVSFVKDIGAEAMTCTVKNNTLSPTWSDAYDPQVPIVDWGDRTGLMSPDWDPDINHGE